MWSTSVQYNNYNQHALSNMWSTSVQYNNYIQHALSKMQHTVIHSILSIISAACTEQHTVIHIYSSIITIFSMHWATCNIQWSTLILWSIITMSVKSNMQHIICREQWNTSDKTIIRNMMIHYLWVTPSTCSEQHYQHANINEQHHQHSYYLLRQVYYTSIWDRKFPGPKL